MPLTAGMRLGPYEIISPLGAGGMGEVYRARDTKLNREVALKVLPDAFAADPDRLARFTREARTLASLNHPNIGAVHGFEEAHGVHALVLELVEGPTLAERIAKAPIPLDEALAIAKQIADALGSAHAGGIVHRDLKPANIKIRPDGRVKVLDFGLAKLTAPDAPAADPEHPALSNSPTMATLATESGIVLGTAAYMAPEQARGGAVDKRADNWAFGVVLYEMLTGRRLFARHSVAETMAAVLQEEPAWDRIPATVRRLLRSCLQKDAGKRLHDIADAHLLMDDVSGSAPTASPVGRLGWLVAGVLALAAAGLAWGSWRTGPSAAAPVRFHIAPGVSLAASGASAISPDGRHLAFIGSGPDGIPRVWVRDMESLVERPLSGTEVRGPAPPPFWSPDSRFIAFDAGGVLKKVEVSGGLAQTICDLPTPAVGGSWNRDGVVLFGSVNGPIMRVPDTGGTPSAVTAIDSAQDEAMHLTPVFLPDGRHFLYLRASRSPERAGIVIGSIDATPDAQDRRRLLATPTSAAYVPGSGSTGTLLFLRDGNLLGQSFDEGGLVLSGDPWLVAERVDSYRDTSTMSASGDGVLVYRSAASLRLAWLDRQGREVGEFRERGLYETLSLSRDGTRAVVSKASSQATSSGELWVLDFARDLSTRLTPASANDAAWSPDGSRVIFDVDGALREKRIGMAQEDVVLKPGENGRKSPTSWSPDGSVVLYTVNEPKTGSDIWALSMGSDRTTTPFLRSEASESQGQFRPGGARPTWVAYTANGSGRDEVLVRTFPDAGNVQIVSRSGGHSPRWRGDGGELFYIAADGMVMAVALADGPERPGAPTPLFSVPRGFASRDATGSRAAAPWAVTPDGQRFLFAVPEEASGLTQFTVVLNWRASPGT